VYKRQAQHGTVLKAGEIILAGSFTKPMWVYKGDEIVADFGPLGVITCHFA
jgi:2-oxo-hept-3-ene-1,7-dioate hydratase